MKKLNYGVIFALVATLVGCSLTKNSGTNQPGKAASNSNTSAVQTENVNKAAFTKATELTSGWPEGSTIAAREIIQKYGDPQEVTSESLIWRNVAPFKKIIVHKSTFNHRFPLMHQDSLEHVVDYKAPTNKVDDIWRYNGSVSLDRTKGQMSAFGENEAMNILSLNLAHDIMTGKRGMDNARITYGKETLNFLNGNKTAYTQVLTFGNQFQTPDAGESISNKIRWQGDQPRTPAAQSDLNLRQAQEEKSNKKSKE